MCMYDTQNELGDVICLLTGTSFLFVLQMLHIVFFLRPKVFFLYHILVQTVELYE